MKNGSIINVDYSEEMKKSYINYAVAVLTDRAVPDIRDGFKPIHRRILFTMFKAGHTPDKPYAKSAIIVGQILAIHPHGDTAAYNAMVRLSQDFIMRYPLIDFHGNGGSISGDTVAAFRYTEAKLSLLSLECLNYLKYNTVDMKLNYLETGKEPCYLPVVFPNLLVNGSVGIAVGMTTNIPPHNMRNTIDSFIKYIDNENISTKDILKTLKGPDFPTGGTIINKKDLVKIYENGTGTITIRGNYNIEENNGKTKIIINEIPYTISGKEESFVESIIKLAKNKSQLQITNVTDESSKEGIRIVIELKKNADYKLVLSYLYKYTQFEDKIPCSFLCLVNNKPKIIGIKEYFKNFFDFQKDIYKKKYEFIYNKNEENIEKLNGLNTALSHIDSIVALIKNTESLSEIKNTLITGICNNSKVLIKYRKELSKLRFTEKQANIILNTKLGNLTHLDKIKIESNIKSLKKENDQIKKILDNEKILIEKIKENLIRIRSKYGDPRRTRIIDKNDDFIEIEKKYDINITENYIRKTNDPNGKYTDNDRLCILNPNEGANIIKIKDIPLCDSKNKGIAAENFTNGSKISKIIDLSQKEKFLIVTSGYYAKIVNNDEFNTNRSKLKGNNSRIIFIEQINDQNRFLEINSKKIPINEIPNTKRTVKGKHLLNNKNKIISIKII